MEEPIYEQKEKIKLSKMTKGFNWEISLLGNPEFNLERLKKINEEMRKNYGNE